MDLGPLRVEFKFTWYDLWIGVYWDREARALYVLPFPCLRFKITKPLRVPPWMDENEGYASAVKNRAIQLILAERVRQKEERGEDRYKDIWWSMIVAEELGKITQAILKKDYTLEEVIQLTATGLIWIEDILQTIWGKEIIHQDDYYGE